MRRAVRATLLSTVVGAAGVALLLLLLVGMLADPLLRPIVARGDRLEQAVQAAHDIPMLFTPGASIGDFVAQPVGTSGRVPAQVGRPSAPGGGRWASTGRIGWRVRLSRVPTLGWPLEAVSRRDAPRLHLHARGGSGRPPARRP
jgi:hypothetical protein